MKNLVRGGALLLLSSLFVLIIFAQTKTETPLATATDSQAKIENKITDTNLDKTAKTLDTPNKILEKADKSGTPDDDKNVVKTTAVVSAKVAGTSRGSLSASANCFSARTAMGHGIRRAPIAAAPRVWPQAS